MARFQLRGRQQLQALIRRVDGVRAALPRVIRRELDSTADLARGSFERQFTSGGAEFGAPWRQLQASTRERKQRAGFPAGRILVRTGSLLRSLTERGKGHLELVGRDRLTMSSTISGAAGGENLVEFHGRTGRQVVHPETGVAGRGLQEIERAWVAAADQLQRALEGRGSI